MGIFNIFKKKPKFVDSLFGELIYTKFAARTFSFHILGWQQRMPFPSLARIEVFKKDDLIKKKFG